MSNIGRLSAKLLFVCLAVTFFSCGYEEGDEGLHEEDLATKEQAVFVGYVYGRVSPVVPTTITTSGGGSAQTLPNGYFAMPHLAGTGFLLFAQASGYRWYFKTINVNEFGSTYVDIQLKRW